MDIMLKRILSLIPKKENGDFKHGSLAAFARPLGFKDGHIISDWISGNSVSYSNYLYQIASLHDVSIEWLKGETDEKTPPAGADGASEKDRVILELSKQLSEDQKDLLIAQLKILGAQK